MGGRKRRGGREVGKERKEGRREGKVEREKEKVDGGGKNSAWSVKQN